jgi:hypothetical protein
MELNAPKQQPDYKWTSITARVNKALLWLLGQRVSPVRCMHICAKSSTLWWVAEEELREAIFGWRKTEGKDKCEEKMGRMKGILFILVEILMYIQKLSSLMQSYRNKSRKRKKEKKKEKRRRNFSIFHQSYAQWLLFKS